MGSSVVAQVKIGRGLKPMLGVSLLNTGSNSGITMRSGGNQTACFVAVKTVHECLKELEMADCIDCCIFGEQPMLLMSTADLKSEFP